MKKLILAMVFVFATGTMVNAKASINETSPDSMECAEYAWNEVSEAASQNSQLSDWDLWEMTDAVYEDCMG